MKDIIMSYRKVADQAETNIDGTEEVFAQMMAGLESAKAYLAGDTSRGRVAASVEVKQVRAATGKTQAEFAEAYGLPLGTVKQWEIKRRVPDAPAQVLLSIIARDPVTVERLVAEAHAQG